MKHFNSGNPTTPLLLAVILVLASLLVYSSITRPPVPAPEAVAGTHIPNTPATTTLPARVATSPQSRQQAPDDAECALCEPVASSTRYTRTKADYKIPALTLINAAGQEVPLAAELNHDGPVMMQFIFTTCPTICPVMSATFAAVQRDLPPALEQLRLVSISIDPEHDTAARLKQYSEQFAADSRWHFLTGSRLDIARVQQAFDAYQDSKMRHAPLTFIRESRGASWLRLDGLMSAQELLAELAPTVTAGEGGGGSPSAAGSGGTDLGDPELGRRIYHEGILPSGERIRASTLGDVAITGAQVHCASCHRASGFAGGEETVYVPPITGPALYQERELDRGTLFRKLFQDVQPQATTARVQDGRYRPAYTDQSLAAAIRQGHDPTGRELGTLMPRYQLSDPDLGHLIAYLKSMSAAPPLGVDDTTLHFATVVVEGDDPDQRAAMLEVIDAYVRRKNADTQAKLSRPGFSPLYKSEFSDAWRLWQVHTWELTGAPETWRDQLATFYHHRPVFALLSGSGAGSWRPVHEFCEQAELPCLFPNTELPASASPSNYTLYFSKGLALDAEVVAAHLLGADSPTDQPRRLLQIGRDAPRSRALADSLQVALGVASDTIQLQRTVIQDPAPPTRDQWQKLLGLQNTTLATHTENEPIPPATRVVSAGQQEEPAFPTDLALWLEAPDLKHFPWDDAALTNVSQIHLSFRMSGDLPDHSIPDNVRDKISMAYPFALPGHEPPRIFRVRAWLRSRRIALRGDGRVQLNTYFALSIVDHALVHLVGNFNRDYLIESIEHDTEKGLNPGVFPHLSLGPGQRFASKGAYLVRPQADRGGFEALSPWLVP